MMTISTLRFDSHHFSGNKLTLEKFRLCSEKAAEKFLGASLLRTHIFLWVEALRFCEP